MKRINLVVLGIAAALVAWSLYLVVASAWSQQISIRTTLAGFQEAFLTQTLDPTARAAPHELADLRAQQRMADATELLAEFTLGQLIIAAIGSLALGLTLYMNHKTLQNSAEQLRESQRQTRLTHRLGLTQLRAYVSVEAFKFEGNGVGRWKGSATVRNRGQTPALNVKVRMRIATAYRADKNIPWDEDGILKSVLHTSTIAAGGRMGPGGELQIDQQFLTLATRHQAWIHLFVLVEYDDVFGTSYRRRGSAGFTGANLEIQAPTREGNDETVVGTTGFALELERSETAASN